jgi:hypothetical protein
LTREKYKKYVSGLSDYEPYLLAKKNIITERNWLDIFSWQSDIIFNESGKRHPDIYRSASEVRR